MTRATAAEVLKRFGGTYPTGLDATSVGNLCDAADGILDSYKSLSTSATDAIALANDVAANLCMYALWMQAGGVLSGQSPPLIVTEEIQRRIAAISEAGDTYSFATTVDMIED